MNPNMQNEADISGRDRSATFGMQNDSHYTTSNQHQEQSQGNNQASSFEEFLTKYEFLRLNYENEGISQQSLLLLRRLSKTFHDETPELCNQPILKAMITVCKKLMLNDFEIMIWSIYLKETASHRPDFIDYLDVSAMFVKKDLNEPDVFKIFETFLAHNHYDTYARYASSSKPQVTLTLRRINFYHMTLLAPFDEQRDKEIQDFNYEVDALEDEHVRREVHTTKIVAEEEEAPPQNEPSEVSNEQSESRGIKRSRKGRGRGKKMSPPQTPSIKVEEKPKYPSLQVKREAKKSFDLPKDNATEKVSDAGFHLTSRFGPSPGNPIAKPPTAKKSPILFSQISNRVMGSSDRRDNKSPFASNGNALQPAIPPPFKKPMMSMESMNGGLGGYDPMDDGVSFNMLYKSIEKMSPSVSREFMDRHHADNNDHKNANNIFESFTPFASGEFGKLFDNNHEQHRNLLHPTPKYQK